MITLFRQGNHAEAIRVAEKAAKIATKEFGPDHICAKTAENNLLLLYRAKNQKSGIKPGELQKTANKVKKVSLIKISLVVLFFLSIVSTSGLVMGMAQKPEPAVVSAPQVTENFLPAYRPFYLVRADFYPESRTIKGEEEVLFEHQTPGEEVIFNLHLNRYSDSTLNSSEMRKYSRDRGMEAGYIDIQDVSYRGEHIPFREEGQLLKVSLDNHLFSPGEQALKIKFEIRIPWGADRVGGNDKGVWLGNWLPTLSVDGQGYKPTEIGDPYVNLSSTYEVSFSVPKDYELVLSNVDCTRQEGERKVYQGRVEQVRDLPVFLNKDYQEVVAKQGETKIHYYYSSSGSRRQEVLHAAQEAMAFYEQAVGDYPWEELNIVENDMYLNGMEYSTLLLLSTRAIKNNCKRTIFHEVGHQWFYNIIGSNQYHAPFMDEGCVEFLTSYALDGKKPRLWNNLDGLGQDLGYFDTWYEYRQVHYHNGQKWFESLCFALGEEKFGALLQEYYNDYKFDLVTVDEFKRFITERTNDQSVYRLLDYMEE